MKRSTLLALLTLTVLGAACGGQDTTTLGSATLQEGVWCPEDRTTFVGPLPQECVQ